MDKWGLYQRTISVEEGDVVLNTEWEGNILNTKVEAEEHGWHTEEGCEHCKLRNHAHIIMVDVNHHEVHEPSVGLFFFLLENFWVLHY